MIRSICFIIPEFVYRETGGAELQVSLIANELLCKGWKVEIVAIRGNPQEMGNKLINAELVKFASGPKSGYLNLLSSHPLEKSWESGKLKSGELWFICGIRRQGNDMHTRATKSWE